ncbi:TIR domain-containing protein [Actinoplanes sp. URMC 104]|uniref:TIR domain-containing protein n=1 Tax=Actinoplanes sp. URMC 104 TaxID=3423409 RepID=UPI003F1BD8E5
MSLGDAEQLRAVVADLEAVAAPAREPSFAETLDAVTRTTEGFAAAWCGMNVTEYASWYFSSFSPPPANTPFSDVIEGTGGNSTDTVLRDRFLKAEWRNFTRDEVQEAILRAAGDVDLAPLRTAARDARRTLTDARWAVLSLLSAGDDAFLADLRQAVEGIKPPTVDELVNRHLEERRRALATDLSMAGRALRAAPHEEMLFQVQAIHAVFAAVEELIVLASRAAVHLVRLAERPAAAAGRQLGTHVFIGHGHSPLWRDLKDFVVERLHLPYDEFNRVPIAGTTNIDRLAQMLDNAAVAFLLLTAEDEHADGSLMARQNVIHEAGLFQGRLGFSRAIIMIEEGCESFSNVDGLGQIRFPRGDLRATFETVRQVLEREGLLAG